MRIETMITKRKTQKGGDRRFLLGIFGIDLEITDIYSPFKILMKLVWQSDLSLHFIFILPIGRS